MFKKKKEIKKKEIYYTKDKKKVVCFQSSSTPILYSLKINGLTTKQPHHSWNMLGMLKQIKDNTTMTFEKS